MRPIIKFTFFQNRLKQDWEDTITISVGESASPRHIERGGYLAFWGDY